MKNNEQKDNGATGTPQVKKFSKAEIEEFSKRDITSAIYFLQLLRDNPTALRLLSDRIYEDAYSGSPAIDDLVKEHTAEI